MVTHGTTDLLCTPVGDIFGVKIRNEPILTGMTADRQKLREMA